MNDALYEDDMFCKKHETVRSYKTSSAQPVWHMRFLSLRRRRSVNSFGSSPETTDVPSACAVRVPSTVLHIFVSVAFLVSLSCILHSVDLQRSGFKGQWWDVKGLISRSPPSPSDPPSSPSSFFPSML